jgi:dTDP-4-dehydrorhamnose 3,5-epimerase
VALEYNKELKIERTTIDGLLVLELPVHGDSRGWFKENWQREKYAGVGVGAGGAQSTFVPDIRIVQNNISFNASRGTTRGIHAEPWDKYISVATGEIFGAWVDLRAGSPTYGTVFTTQIDPSRAIFVPRGVGNSFQALADNTAYTYLVNAHWSADAQAEYTFVNLGDEQLNIPWPIPLDSAEVELSDKDKAHPKFANVEPMKPKRTLVIGANGQLGRAVRDYVLEHSEFPETFVYTDVVANQELGIREFDFTRSANYSSWNWSQIGTIINCAAYTAVDAAETSHGRKLAWRINATAPSLLAKVATEHDIELVHISSDYVFDGQLCDHPAGVPQCVDCQHSETESFTPLGVYAQTKAAGDLVVQTTPKHIIVRTSWVVGDGNNFVKTMVNLAKKGVHPEVVSDQIGRLTFTDTLAEGIFHLLKSNQYGTYNLTNDGRSQSWYGIAQQVFELVGVSPDAVSPIKTSDYNAKNADPDKPISPRPTNSQLNLAKIIASGYRPANFEEKLANYVKGLL